MSILFKPNGLLDVSTDPSDLPESADGNNVVSSALARCKNLRIDRNGLVQTRNGSSKINASALGQTSIRHIVEQAGVRYAFAGTVLYRNETSIKTGLTAGTWSAVLYNSYNSTTQNVFALNGTDRLRIEGSSAYDWGITAPSSAPTIAVGSSTGLTGDYNAKITYCRKESATVVSESDPSDAATSAVTLANESLSVSWTASSDSQVTHVRVYRTTAGGSVYYHDQDVAVGTTSVDTTTADASLGSAVATNHDRPPLGTFVAGPDYNGYLWIVKDNLLYYCLSKRPEYWPATYYLEVSPPQWSGQCVVFYNGSPYFLTKYSIHYIQGTGHETFFPLRMEAITGAQGPNAALSVRGMGILHVGPDGLYLFSDYDRNITQARFQPVFQGVTTNGVEGAGDLSNSWLVQWRNQVYFGYPGSSDTYPSNILVMNLDNERVTYYDYGREIQCVGVDRYNDRLLAGDGSGYVWELEDPDNTKDDSTAVSWALESKAFTLQTRRHFPRWVKYDVDASDATTATGAVYLDGESHQTHTLSGDRVTKRRLVTSGNGRKCSLRVSGSGPVKIYAVESE